MCLLFGLLVVEYGAVSVGCCFGCVILVAWDFFLFVVFLFLLCCVVTCFWIGWLFALICGVWHLVLLFWVCVVVVLFGFGCVVYLI